MGFPVCCSQLHSGTHHHVHGARFWRSRPKSFGTVDNSPPLRLHPRYGNLCTWTSSASGSAAVPTAQATPHQCFDCDIISGHTSRTCFQAPYHRHPTAHVVRPDRGLTCCFVHPPEGSESVFGLALAQGLPWLSAGPRGGLSGWKWVLSNM